MPLKRFLEWITLKAELHYQNQKPPHVSEGDIWWASLGENIGREINGKDGLFARPVLIYKKLSHDYYFVIPFTSRNHVGYWFVPYSYRGKEMTVSLHQARSIDHRRISNKFGEMDIENFIRIKGAFSSLYTPDILLEGKR